MKSKIIAMILCILTWWFWGHKFYLWSLWMGLLYLILFMSWIPAILSVIDFIVLLLSSKDKFDSKYNLDIMQLRDLKNNQNNNGK